MVTPSRRRSVVEHRRSAYRVSERRACRSAGFHRSSQRYRTRRDPQIELRMRLQELAAARVRYGYRRLHVLLRREGWPVNAKRVHRLYREEGLVIRTKLPKRKRARRHREGRATLGAANEAWAMDFLSDRLFDGRPFRILTVIDGHTREALATVPRVGFRAYQVVEVLDRLATERGRPKQEPAGRQRAGVRGQGARPMGLPEPCGDRLLQARKTHGQRADRGVRRSLTG